MHPAPSIILFTVLSGLGFGNLVFLGTIYDPGPLWLTLVLFAIAFGMAVAGLLASTFHLGHPERAIKAFSQWRSSWLSREGWLACAALIVMGVYALSLLVGSPLVLLGWVGAGLSLATVYATSMIYAQLKTVPRWHHWTTNAVFLGLALGGGALLAGAVPVAIVMLLGTGAVQIFAWSQDLRGSSTLSTATGLGGGGQVRAFEPPHTGENYLTQEMVFQIGRKHASKLRVIAMVLGFALPILLMLLPFAHILALLAIASHIAGVLTLRWLFFAEAAHVVSLYYGRNSDAA